MFKRLTFFIISLVLIITLTACKGKESAQETAPPQLDAVETFRILKTKAVQTAQAQQTLVSIFEPTRTPARQEVFTPAVTEPAQVAQPTIEPTLSLESPAPEILLSPSPRIATFTPVTSNSEYDCQAAWVAPAPGQEINPNIAFEAHWRVTNTGTQSWDQHSVDLMFMDGERLHTTAAVIDLPETINPGGTIDLFIPMQAPPQSGFFQTAWVLKRGNRSFCSLNISLEVNVEP